MDTTDAGHPLRGSEPRLNVSLFGALAVQLHAQGAPSRTIALTGRTRSLFALLALSRCAVHTRNELADILWSRSGDIATAGTFNTALWRLRQAVECPPLPAGAVIVCDRNGQIGLCSERWVHTDVDAYCALVTPALAKPFELLTEADIERLRQGAGLYAGDVLEGFVDDWALRERERRRRQQLNALGRLVQWSVLHDDPLAGIRHAQAILDLDALREDVHRELMRLHMQVGQRAMALRQFERCREALKRELAIVPMRETLHLYQQIADGALSREAVPAARLAAPFDVPLPHMPRAVPIAPPSDGPGIETGRLIAAARSTLQAADLQLQAATRALPPAATPSKAP